MKRKFDSWIVLVCLLAIVFASCASASNSRNTHPQKIIIVVDIPTYLVGKYADISLSVNNENGSFDWVVWSVPVLINNDFTSHLLFDNKPGKSNEPFTKNGVYNVYLKIGELNNQGIPIWQGYVLNFNIKDEVTMISWYDFMEVAG